MKQLSLLLLFIPLIAFSCNHENRFKISGHIKDMDDVPVALQLTKLGKGKFAIPQWYTIDSTKVNKGRFLFIGRLEYPQIMRLKFGDGMHYMKFFGDYGKIKVNANKDRLSDAKIKGSKLHDQYEQFQDQISNFRGKIANLSIKYKKAIRKGNKQKANKYRDKNKQISEKQMSYVKNFVLEHKNSVIAPFIIEKWLLSSIKYDELVSFYNMLPPASKNTKYGQALKEKKQHLESRRTGAKYKNLVLRDTTKNTQNLSEYIGKGYVLLEFWASWCGPCREEIPNLKKAYIKFDEHNFEIIGISLDKNRKAWLKALHQEDITWPQFRDKNPSKQSSGKYQINGIPFNVLINPEGKIVATNLRGNELDNKLNEIYSNK